MAITLNGIYFGTCDRQIGLIVNVDKNSIQLLGLDGKIRKISRYDIIYLTNYPIGNIPVQKIVNPEEKKIVVINTLVENREEELVRGWPVEFSEQSILILTTTGEEVIVDRGNIFSFSLVEQKGQINFKGSSSTDFHFRYPALFAHCEEKNGLPPKDNGNNVYPQQVIDDALLIKSKLDHLMNGYERINKNLRNQKFYPVPNVYTNDVKVGIWYNFGSRHAVSKGRENNLIPVIINQLNEGPFEFQREVISGTYILPDGIHEEPQTQVTYQFKSAYFHFSAFIDPYIILAGANYSWKSTELEDNDHRVTNLLHINAGFDYKNFQFETGIQGLICGVRSGDRYELFNCGGLRYGIIYQNRFIKTDFYYMSGESGPPDENQNSGGYYEGLGAEINSDLKFYRFNLHLKSLKNKKFMYSLISYALRYNQGPDIRGWGEFSYQSSTLTNAFYMDYDLGNDVSVGGYVSLESVTDESQNTIETFASKTRHYPKTGISAMLTF